MAWEVPVLDVSLIASDDFTDNQFYFVKVNSDGEIELAGDGEAALGVLQNKPEKQRKRLVRRLLFASMEFLRLLLGRPLQQVSGI